MEAELWTLFGGRAAYMAAPIPVVRRQQLRWQAQKQAEAQISEQVDSSVAVAESEIEAVG